jgi:DNA polymerase-3 subunit delta
MELKPSQVERQLAGSGDLAPVWLIAGEEHLLVLEAADAVRRRARELGYSEREVLEVESGFDWNEFARAGANLSLFASRRLIDLRLPNGRPDKHPRKDGAEAIAAFCAAPPPDTVLLITAMSWSRGHETAWVDAVRSAGVLVVAWPLKLDETRQWVAARATRAGLRLDAEAVEALVARVEGNLLAASQEIDKLVLNGAAGAPLGAARLEELVADSARFDVFKLADAALSGDAARAVRIVGALRAEGDQVPGLVPVIAMQVAIVHRLAAAVESGMGADQALRAERGIWQARYPIYRAAIARGRVAYWEARLADLARVEKAGKGRLPWLDPWVELERAVAAIADPRVARAVSA